MKINEKTSPNVIKAAMRIFEVFCGGNVDWARHSIADSEDSIFSSYDWEMAIIYATAALNDKDAVDA